MKQIKTNSELITNSFYWCREKKKPNTINLIQCKSANNIHDAKYIDVNHYTYMNANDNIIWAMDNNNQALERWDIVGPVPELNEHSFMEIIKNEI